MCKIIRTSMALGYGLFSSKEVTFKRLSECRQELMKDGYLLDVSHRTVAEIVEESPEMDLEVDRDGAFVVKRNPKLASVFRDKRYKSHLEWCFKNKLDFPRDEDYAKVVRVFVGNSKPNGMSKPTGIRRARRRVRMMTD